MRKRKSSGLVLGVGTACGLVGFAAGWWVGSVSVVSDASTGDTRAQAAGVVANQLEKRGDDSLDPEKLTALMAGIQASGADPGDNSLLKLDPNVLNTAILKDSPALAVDGH